MHSETLPDPGHPRSLCPPEVPATHAEAGLQAGRPEPADLLRRLAEPYAFALLLWPAVGALMLNWPAEPWTTYARGALWLWLGAMHLAAYTGGRGAGFGNAVALMSGTVAAACTAFPSAWSLACLPVLLITLYAAQRLRIGTPGAAERPAATGRQNSLPPLAAATVAGRAGASRVRPADSPHPAQG